MSSGLVGLELWDNVALGGGTRCALVGNWLACSEEVSLEGDNTMTLTLLRDNPALITLGTLVGSTNAEPQAVLRAVYGDATFVERRIESVEERDDAGQVTFALVARGMLHELSMRGLVFREHPDGTRTYHFQAAGLTARQHITNYVLPALTEAGQAFWADGQIDSTVPVSVVYSADSPLAVLRKLETVTGMELQVRYGPPSYRLDLLTQVGATAPIVRVHADVNLLATGFGRSAADVVNRVYAFGADDPEFGRATMGGNAWIVTALRTDEIGQLWAALEDPAGGPGPIGFDGQFGVTPEGQHRLVPVNEPFFAGFYILDSKADTQELRVRPYTAGLQSTVPLYRIMHGNRSLAYVEHPGSRSAFEPRVGSTDQFGAGMHLNYIRNPIQRRAGTGDVGLEDWFKSGNVTSVVETNPIYWRTGGRSLRCTFNDNSATVVALGFATGFGDGRLSYFGDIRVLSGEIEVSLIVNLMSQQQFPNLSIGQQLIYPVDWLRLYPTLTFDDVPQPVNVGSDAWERIGLEGCHDLSTYPAVSAYVQFRASAAPATVLIDAAQITNTQTQRDLVEGTGANALLQAANDRLARYADLAITLGVETLDFSTVDDPRFPFNQYAIGGRIQVYNDRLAQAVETRVLGWSRDWMDPHHLQLQISSARADVSRILAQRVASTPAAVGA